MIEHALQGELRLWARGLLEQDALFGKLQPKELDLLMTSSRLLECEAGEKVYNHGEPSDSFSLLLAGSVSVLARHAEIGGMVEAEVLEAPHFIGITSLLARKNRQATMIAQDRMFMMQFHEGALEKLIRGLPVFAYRLSYSLSKRITDLAERTAVPEANASLLAGVNQDVLGILPIDYLQEHGILALGIWGNVLKVCFHETPPRHAIESIRDLLPGIQVHLYRTSAEKWRQVLTPLGHAPKGPASSAGSLAGGGLEFPPPSTGAMAHVGTPPIPGVHPPDLLGGGPPVSSGNGAGAETNQLIEALMHQTAVLQQSFALQQKEMPSHILTAYASGSFKKAKRRELSANEKRQKMAQVLPLLQQMAQENASDLHISAGQRMRWRIDGELFEIEESRPTGEEEVLELLGPMMKDENIAEFQTYNHTDFSYELEGLARYRVNIYREGNGISAALRQIPIHIPSVKEIGLPGPVVSMAELNQGLVLVTGPTGSGKSTTMAALIRQINEWKRTHIITMEDPIEFVHKSDKALIHQREIGPHTPSFSAGLRAALREDPDIVMVGEMRDMETMALAIETAHTGHLVFGTLHTNNVIATVDRIIDLFPSEQQNQIRGSLSEVLKGVICQVLCKRTSRGRVGAYEVMTVNSAIANLIRSEKTHQIPSAMTGKSHLLLNQQLEELVRKRVIDKREAILRAYDKIDMKQRLGMDVSDLQLQSKMIKDGMQGRGIDRLQRSGTGENRGPGPRRS